VHFVVFFVILVRHWRGSVLHGGPLPTFGCLPACFSVGIEVLCMVGWSFD
jgi:hypothetical protein